MKTISVAYNNSLRRLMKLDKRCSDSGLEFVSIVSSHLYVYHTWILDCLLPVKRAKRVLESLLDDPLDYNKISNLCFEGTIRTKGLRALYWKVG